MPDSSRLVDSKGKKFSFGETVRLSIGGPDMVAAEWEQDDAKPGYRSPTGRVLCSWFAGKKRESEGFRPHELVVVGKEEADAEAKKK